MSEKVWAVLSSQAIPVQRSRSSLSARSQTRIARTVPSFRQGNAPAAEDHVGPAQRVVFWWVRARTGAGACGREPARPEKRAQHRLIRQGQRDPPGFAGPEHKQHVSGLKISPGLDPPCPAPRRPSGTGPRAGAGREGSPAPLAGGSEGRGARARRSGAATTTGPPSACGADSGPLPGALHRAPAAPLARARSAAIARRRTAAGHDSCPPPRPSPRSGRLPRLPCRAPRLPGRRRAARSRRRCSAASAGQSSESAVVQVWPRGEGQAPRRAGGRLPEVPARLRCIPPPLPSGRPGPRRPSRVSRGDAPSAGPRTRRRWCCRKSSGASPASDGLTDPVVIDLDSRRTGEPVLRMNRSASRWFSSARPSGCRTRLLEPLLDGERAGGHRDGLQEAAASLWQAAYTRCHNTLERGRPRSAGCAAPTVEEDGDTLGRPGSSLQPVRSSPALTLQLSRQLPRLIVRQRFQPHCAGLSGVGLQELLQERTPGGVLGAVTAEQQQSGGIRRPQERVSTAGRYRGRPTANRRGPGPGACGRPSAGAVHGTRRRRAGAAPADRSLFRSPRRRRHGFHALQDGEEAPQRPDVAR